MITKPETIDGLKTEITHLPEDQVILLGSFCMERAEALKAERHQRILAGIAAKKAALAEEERALLAANGIAYKAATSKNVKPKKGASQFKSGHLYQHPDDPTKQWKGMGVKPGWVSELLAKGRMPVDKGLAAKASQ